MKVVTISLITILISSSLWGKSLSQTQESHPLIEKCLQEILAAELVKNKFPDLLTNQFDKQGYEFLKEADRYCQCHAKSLKDEQDLKQKDRIAFEFRDRSQSHSNMDQCSLKHFSKYNLGLYFEIMVSTRIRHKLENRLQGRMIAGVRHFASQGSVQNRLLCLETQILKRCTKIQSIHSTYKCVQTVLSNSKSMEVIGQKCPNFKTNDEDFQSIGDLI